MGIMVGGSWGAAGLVLFSLSFIVEKIGLMNVMLYVCALYLIALLIAVSTAIFNSRKVLK